MELMKDTTSLAGGFDLADLFPSIKLLHVVSGMKPKLMKMHRKIDDVLESIIRERRMASTEESEQREEDPLDVLLRLEKTGGLEFPITDDNIKAIIFVSSCVIVLYLIPSFCFSIKAT
ncbi:Premnaspirodiene oxygenase [Camellia lanceoleosa]|uniref:Premnaspirodiene oxygenase n=1 Tax=Camellia lanceoleosa TaxID=1840588 RepID=A0ACC0FM08_9ERIC|nr:Premnaspirodiene oxygenase [Camellia lanceoleosa]